VALDNLQGQRILVTGGTGAVGHRVIEALQAAGAAVRVFALDDPGTRGVPGAEYQQGNVGDRAAVRTAIEGCSGVIHMAALLHVSNPPPSLKARYEEVNVHGTKTVMDEARSAGVSRVVFFSTIAVYEGGPVIAGKVFSEEDRACSTTYYGESKRRAEELVLGAAAADGKPIGTVLRMAAIYGTRVKGNYRKLAIALARRRFIPVGPGENRRTLVYDRDAAAAAVLALRSPVAAGRTFNVTDGQCHSLKSIIEAMCAALGRRPPPIALPVRPVSQAANIVQWVSKKVGRPFSIKAALDKYLEEIMVNGDAIQRDLGFAPSYSLTAGWNDCIQEMRESGEI
jgi:nucleoside-diphosphate-sugar epimerase